MYNKNCPKFDFSLKKRLLLSPMFQLVLTRIERRNIKNKKKAITFYRTLQEGLLAITLLYRDFITAFQIQWFRKRLNNQMAAVMLEAIPSVYTKYSKTVCSILQTLMKCRL